MAVREASLDDCVRATAHRGDGLVGLACQGLRAAIEVLDDGDLQSAGPQAVHIAALMLLALVPQDRRERVVVYGTIKHAVGDGEIEAGTVAAADESGQIRRRDEELAIDETHQPAA